MNLRREPDANTEETVSARLSLLWRATSELSALFAYHLQDQQVGARRSIMLGRLTPAATSPRTAFSNRTIRGTSCGAWS